MTDQEYWDTIDRGLHRLWMDDRELKSKKKQLCFSEVEWQMIRAWRHTNDRSQLRLWELDADILKLRIKYHETAVAHTDWSNCDNSHFPLELVDYDQSDTEHSYELQMFRIRPAPPKMDDLQCYINLYMAEKEDKYFAWFLHYYEAKLNIMAAELMQRYHLPGHFHGLKLSMVYGLWLALLDYNSSSSIPFLTFKTRIMWKQIHEYVRSMRSGYTISSGKEHAKLREIMRLFHQYGEKQDDETIHAIAQQAGRKDKTVKSYLSSGLCNERQADFYHSFADDDIGEDTAEDVTRDLTWEPESVSILLEQNRALMAAFEALENVERDIVAGYTNFCKSCYGNRHDKYTFQELAYRNGLRSAEAAENIYYRALDKLTLALVDAGLCHCIRMKRKQQTVSFVTYQVQVDKTGDWCEIVYDFTTKLVCFSQPDDTTSSHYKEYMTVAIQKLYDMVETNHLLKERLYAVR